jgi:hypothetical protein
MTFKLASLALGFALISPAAFALTADEVIADLQSQGYSHIEIRVGATRIRAEAMRNGEKLETVYDIVSGAVVKRETAPAVARSDRSDAHRNQHAAEAAPSRSEDKDSTEDHVSAGHDVAENASAGQNSGSHNAADDHSADQRAENHDSRNHNSAGDGAEDHDSASQEAEDHVSRDHDNGHDDSKDHDSEDHEADDHDSGDHESGDDH